MMQVLGTLVWSAAWAVFCWPVGGESGALWTVAGCMAGMLMVLGAQRLHVRPRFILLGAVLLGSALWLLPGALLRSFMFVDLVGGVQALGTAEALRWFLAGALVTSLVRGAGLFWRAARVLEAVVVAAALAQPLAAHRDGMIARPLELSDWFWSRGLDPSLAFLAAGLGTAVLLTLLLARKAAFQALLVTLVLAGLVVFQLDRAQQLEEPAASAGGGGGGTEEQRGSGKGGGKAQDLMQDLPATGKGVNRPVAVVVFQGNVNPSGGVLYFRRATFSQFNGSRLVQATREDVDPATRLGFPSGPVELHPALGDALLRSDVMTETSLLTDHDSPFALLDAVEMEPLPNPDPVRFRRAWRTASSVLSANVDLLARLPGTFSTWPKDIVKHYTAYPQDERYAALAKTLRQEVLKPFRDKPLALAMAVKRHLEATSIYTLSAKYDGAQDLAGAFLFSKDRRGYCVHIAHAAAHIMRAMGVPARVSAGYAVPVDQLGSGSALLIRAGNAHAWLEVHDGAAGWVPVEITPEKSEVEPHPFDAKDLQNLLGEMARKRPTQAVEAVAPITLKEVLVALGQAGAWALLTLLALGFLVKAAFRFAPAPSLRTAYRAALSSLAAAGFTRGFGETPEAYAMRVSKLSPSFAVLSNSYVRWALGSARVGEHSPSSLRGSVAREIHAGIPLWRRVVAALHPFSWLAAW